MVDKAVEAVEAARWVKSPASASQTAGFKPIEGLKPGDQVVYDGTGAWLAPKEGGVGTVLRVLSPPVEEVKTGEPIKRLDFTMLLAGEDSVLEFGFDSRHFKRMEK
jgi:hypothetical protein